MKNTYDIKLDIMQDVLDEMNSQDEKWGALRNQHPATWSVILTEEVGEVSKEICDSRFNPNDLSDNYEKELIQVAAVAIQAALDYRVFVKKATGDE